MDRSSEFEDTRNVEDRFKGWKHEDIVTYLDDHGVMLEIAIENLTRDFNMGTIVRTANAFGVRRLHVVGRKQWNKRGAMATDKYLHIIYHATVDDFVRAVRDDDRALIAIDNVKGAHNLSSVKLHERATLVFGSEADGLSDEMLNACLRVVAIEQFGSTRSINVGVAAGIVMYQWIRQNRLHA